MVWHRQAQAKQAKPLGGASSVLDAFLQQQGEAGTQEQATQEQTATPAQAQATGQQARFHVPSLEERIRIREDVTLSDAPMAPKEAVAILEAQKGKVFVNRETNDEATFGTNQIRKLVSNAALAKSLKNGFTASQHNQAVAKVGTLFENASLVEERGDSKGDKNISRILRFVSPAIVNGETCAAYITVKESVEAGERIYSLEMMEIKTLATQAEALASQRSLIASANEIIANLRSKVNTETPKFHVPSAEEPRFSETQEGKVAVAEVFDAMTEGMWDLISDPTTRSQRKMVKRQQVVRDEESFRKEVNIRMNQFGRAGGKRLREVKANLSADQWIDVMGTVFELGHRFDVWNPNGGLLDVSMRNRVADYLTDIIRNRASALGRRSYLAGREFAWRQAKAIAAEAKAKVEERLNEVRESEREKAKKNAEEQKEKFQEALAQTRWEFAEERFIAEYRLAKAEAIAQKQMSQIQEEAKETAKELRLKLARKNAVLRETGVTMKQLIPIFGFDVGDELVRIAYSDADIETETQNLLNRLDASFDKWAHLGVTRFGPRRDRPRDTACWTFDHGVLQMRHVDP